MFDDPKEELKKLEQQLLADEEKQPQKTEEDDWFEKELQEVKTLIGEPRRPATAQSGQVPNHVRNYANNYGKSVRGSGPVDFSKSTFKDEVLEKPKNTSIKVLTIIAILETLGILGLAAYWLLVLWK